MHASLLTLASFVALALCSPTPPPPDKQPPKPSPPAPAPSDGISESPARSLDQLVRFNRQLTRPIEKLADAVILNYALTLEHLEDNFYRGGLAKYDAKYFADAGYPAW